MMEQKATVPSPEVSDAISTFASRARVTLSAAEGEALARTVERLILAVRSVRVEVAADRASPPPTYQT